MFTEKMKNSDIFNVKGSDTALNRSKSNKSNYKSDTMQNILKDNVEGDSNYTPFKPTKKCIPVKSTVFDKGNPFQTQRSRSRPNMKLKESMIDCLKSPYSIIKPKRQVNSNFQPKWEKSCNNKNIQYKNDTQTFSCLGSEKLKSEIKEEKRVKVKAKKENNDYDLNPKETKLKSIYPEISISELKLLCRKAIKSEVEASNQESNVKVKSQIQSEAKRFNINLKSPKGKKIVNNEAIENVGKQNQERNVYNENLCIRSRPDKNININKDKGRPKSTRDIKSNELASNIFHIEKSQELKRTNSFRKKAELNTFFEKFSEHQPTQNSTRQLQPNSEQCEKKYVIKTQLGLKETEIKRILSKKGLHVSSLVVDYNIISNEGFKKVEVNLRTNKEGNNISMLSNIFQCKDVKEKVQPDKPFLLKPKSDLISGSISMLDTKMSIKYRNKNLEASKTVENNKPADYSKLTS